MRSSRFIRSAAALALLLVAPSVCAQGRDRVDTYHFVDDELLGETWGEPPPRLRAFVCGPRRVLMIRPRVAFVAELLKTVETL